MQIGARTAAWAKSGYTAKDYKGLITLNLDGIENVGYGEHAQFTDSWIDLSGNGNDFILESREFDDKSLLLKDNVLGGYLYKIIPCAYYEAILLIRSGGIGSNYGETNPLFFGDYTALGITTKNFGGLPVGYTYFTGRVAPRYFANTSEYTYPLGKVARVSFDLSTATYCVDGVRRSCLISNDAKGFDYGLSCIGGRKSVQYRDGYFNGNLYAVRCFKERPSDKEIAANYAIDKARFGLT